MRDVAVTMVNTFARRKVDSKSDLFNGFARFKGKYHPIVAKPKRGVKTYHTSNVYQTLRDGCSFLVQGGFVELEEQISYGFRGQKTHRSPEAFASQGLSNETYRVRQSAC